MKLGKLYNLVVKCGMKADPRPKSRIAESLAQARIEYRKLKKADKVIFDKEKLKNPYADTRMLHGDPDTEVRTVMVGIDIGGEELLLCNHLRQMGRSIDLVMSHHPHGAALARISQVMNMQACILNKWGIPIDVAKELMSERIEEVRRSFQGRNYKRYIDFARLLDIPYMCCHTVADNHVATFLQCLLDKARPKKLKDVLTVLNRMPEYREASAADVGPQIVVGKPDDQTGKVFVDMTGGTEGSKRVFARLSQAGVKTLVSMHLSEAHIKAARKEYINLVIASHMASDSIGMNLLLDKLCKIEDFELICCSGFKRVKR